MKKTLPVYELYIADEDFDEITAIGFVDNPAIQADFVYFNDQKINNYTMAEIIAEKKIVVGPAMIPNKKIIRQDPQGELYYVHFTAETIENLAHDFLTKSRQHLTTEQHVDPVNGLHMIESWTTKNEQDKIYTEYGYDPKVVQVGSWCIMYKIDNEDILAKIKSGEIRGFSIEGYLSEKLESHNQLDELLKRVENHPDKQEIIDILKSAQ